MIAVEDFSNLKSHVETILRDDLHLDCSVDDDGDLFFNVDDLRHFVILRPQDPSYFQLLISGRLSQEGDADPWIRAVDDAINMANRTCKGAKLARGIHIQGEDNIQLNCSVETVVGSIDSVSIDMMRRYLSMTRWGLTHFFAKYSERREALKRPAAHAIVFH